LSSAIGARPSAASETWRSTKARKLAGVDQQVVDGAVVLAAHGEHLEHLPALGLDAAHELGHVLAPVEGGDDGVELEPQTAGPDLVGEDQAARDVPAGPAPERGLHGLVGAVDREADPVEVTGVRGEQLRQPGAVADDAGDEAEPARLGEQRADVRVQGRLTAGEVELLAAGLAEQPQQGSACSRLSWPRSRGRWRSRTGSGSCTACRGGS
jgi:hypothetical protein